MILSFPSQKDVLTLQQLGRDFAVGSVVVMEKIPRGPISNLPQAFSCLLRSYFIKINKNNKDQRCSQKHLLCLLGNTRGRGSCSRLFVPQLQLRWVTGHSPGPHPQSRTQGSQTLDSFQSEAPMSNVGPLSHSLIPVPPWLSIDQESTRVCRTKSLLTPS